MKQVFIGRALREIETEFDNEGFQPGHSYDPPEGGQRRCLVEQIYRGIRFNDPDHVRRLLRIYDEIVRIVRKGNEDLANELNASIRADGINIDNEGKWIVPNTRPDLADLKVAADRLNAASLDAIIHRISDAVNRDPALAVGTAKELIESVCKTILSDREPALDTKPLDFPKLVKETYKSLELLPDNIPDQAKGAASMKRLLSGLSGAVGGLGELRNLYGSGHGPDGRVKGLTSRHAKLAVGLSTTLAVFLFQTHEERSGKH